MKFGYVYAILLMQSLILCSMDQKIQKQIEELDTWRDQTFKQLRQENAGCDTQFSFNEQYRYRLSAIVMQHMNVIPNQDKLNLLQGDSFYTHRKTIIKDMIEKDKVNPNTIMYQGYENPLFESVSHKDQEFTNYLWDKGARPDQKTQFMMRFQLEDLEKNLKK